MSAYLIVQTGPEAVVDVATTAILNHEPSKARLEALEAVIAGGGRGRCCYPQRALVLGCCGGGWLSLAVGGIVVVIAGTAVTVVALDLGIKAGDYALKAAQSLEQLSIGGFPALSRGTAGAWEDTVDFGAHTVGAWVLFVTFDLAPTAGNARPGIWCRCRSGAGRGAVGSAAWLVWIGRVLAGASRVGHCTHVQISSFGVRSWMSALTDDALCALPEASDMHTPGLLAAVLLAAPPPALVACRS